MPYPMIRWPTFKEFREKLEMDCECQYKEFRHSIAMAGGADVQRVHYLQREVNGAMKRYAVAIPDDERIDPLVIRSICRHLGVDPTVIGLHLG